MAVAASTLGAAAPLWAPPLLSTVPAFRVGRVEVMGARLLGEEEVRRLAALPPGASVWDDQGPVETRVAAHPLVEEARARRVGARTLRLRVREREPVALVATPRLVAVDREGRILPLAPARHALDLPILMPERRGSELQAELEGDRLTGAAERRLLELLARLGEHDPALVERISELRAVPGNGVELRLLEGSGAERLLLPLREPLDALRRVEAALAEAARTETPVTADARFRGMVVLRGKEGA